MNKKKIAEELVAVAKEAAKSETFKCPECGSKVLEQTSYCVKCKKKVKKASGGRGPELVHRIIRQKFGFKADIDEVRKFYEENFHTGTNLKKLAEMFIEQHKRSGSSLFALDMDRKDLEEALEFLRDELVDYMDEQVAAEIVADAVGSDWQAYNSRDVRSWIVAKNMKGKGFPDYKKIIQEVAKKEKMDEEEVEENFSLSTFDDLFWDEVKFQADTLSENIIVAGRSGGYWGVEFDTDMVDIDRKKVERYIKKISDKDIDSEADHVDEVVYYLKDKYTDEDLLDADEKWVSRLKKLDKEIEGVIKTMESTKYWVDTILANEYHI